MQIKKITPFASLIMIVALFATGCSFGKTYITTSLGEITFTRAEFVDELMGQTAPPGKNILYIFFENKDGEITTTTWDFNIACSEVFLTTSSGNEFYRFKIGGWEHDEYVLAFLIPESATGLMLNWPGNDPIPIKIQGQ